MFNRLYQATGDPLFLDTALRWFEHAVHFRQPGLGVGGYRAWHFQKDWQDEPGIVEGAAGVGLALAAAMSSVPPDWDRLLLVAIPPKETDARGQ